MNNSPITISNHSEFEAALRRGLGRAVLCLQNDSVTPDRDMILYACTHNLAYDRQTEENRTLYMFDIIVATGESDFYARRVEEALSQENEEQSVSQMFDLLGLLAKNGDTAARHTLYRYFEAHAASDSYLAETLVDIDGVEGYLFAVRQWITHSLSEDDRWYESFLRDRVEERFGAEAVRETLLNTAHTEPAVGIYLAKQEEERALEKARRKQRSPLPQPGYDELCRLIADPSKRLGHMVWARFGEYLSDGNAERLAQDLLQETDTERLIRYLYLFGRRPFPLDHHPLLSLARGTDEKVVTAALFGLAQATHPSMHDLALEKIESPHPWESLGLLVRNYQTSDPVMIESILEKSWDPDELHWIGLRLRDIFESNLSPGAIPVLTRFYEIGFCTLCRQGIIELLTKLGPLPPWMIDECRYDAYEGIRQLVLPANTTITS